MSILQTYPIFTLVCTYSSFTFKLAVGHCFEVGKRRVHVCSQPTVINIIKYPPNAPVQLTDCVACSKNLKKDS
jgi:hypothetical protein